MKFTIATVLFQIILLVLYATLVDYDPEQSGPSSPGKNNGGSGMNTFPLFQDVNVMIFVGIGYLISFLKRFGYGAVGYNFYIGALCAQWYIIIAGCLHHRGEDNSTIYLNVNSLIAAAFAAAVVLISICCILGKVNRLQLLILCIIETVMYAVNEFILYEELRIADVGGSMVVHVFACYFGLTLSFIMRRPADSKNHPKETAVYHSDIFSMIGTLFLWLFWPSFNSILATPGNDQQRAVLNTYLSIATSCGTVFAVSSLVNKDYKLNMAHVQNATLAGGVAVGTTANMLIGPWCAILLGFLAGVISVIGFKYIQPYLHEKFDIHDVCGVHNLHGLPGLLAAIAGAIAAKFATKDIYKDSLGNVFAAVENGRSPAKQAGYQLLALLITLGLSIVSGAITGFIVKLKIFDPPTREQLFDDEDFWEDVNVMIFVGIGYLISFLKRFGYGAIGYNFYIGALSAQWYIIVAGCLHHRGEDNFTIYLNVNSLIAGTFAAAVVLISICCILGEVSRLQLLILCIIETVMYAVNEFILYEELRIADVGGSMEVHVFACYFGLTLSFIIRRPADNKNHPKETAVYHSDIFSMIGTLFLWLFWPSFNSILATPGNDQQRAVLNTYLSIATSCGTVFAVSSLVNKDYKLNMAHVQNATLAGGVAVGTTANMLIGPWGAILLGCLAGVISVIGFKYIQPFLHEKVNVHDVCGAHNIHGLPGLLATIAGAIAAKFATKDVYKDSLGTVFAAVADGRSPGKQAGYQLLALLIAVCLSIVSGAITGFIVKLKIFDPPTREQLFDDEDFWEVPKEKNNDIKPSGETSIDIMTQTTSVE